MFVLFQVFIALLIGHAFADFVLQSGDMSRGKRRNAGVLSILGRQRQVVWPYWLAAHAIMHGTMVLLCTRQPLLGLAEAITHAVIDFGKCEGKYGVHTDQFLHLLCKVMWLTLLLFM
jgi:hypothetical protein